MKKISYPIFFLGNQYKKLRMWQSPFRRKLHKFLFKLIAHFSGRNLIASKIGSISIEGDTNKCLWNFEKCRREMEENGFYFFSSNPDAFDAHHNQVIKRANKIISNNLEKISASPTKNYLHRVRDIEKDDMAFFYNYFTNQEYLKLAALYLNDMPLISELKLLVSPSFSSKAMNSLQGSQLFHSDFDDERILKVFIFLNDVDESSGPLQAIRSRVSKKLMKACNYRWGSSGLSHNDNIASEIDPNNIKSFIGPSGSICFIDSVNCLHRGSRNPTRERRILYASYTTRTSFRYPPLNWIGFLPKTNTVSSPLLKLDPQEMFLNNHALNR